MYNDLWGGARQMVQAIDGTLYVAVGGGGDDLDGWELLKSTDSGRSWDTTDYYDDVGNDNDNMIVDIVCSSLDADIVYVTDGTDVFWTDDGDNFETLGAPPSWTAGYITCMDVGYLKDDIDDPYIFVGTAGATMDDVVKGEQGSWGVDWLELDIGTDREDSYENSGQDVDVFDVKAIGEAEVVIAVVSANYDDGDTTEWRTFLTSKFGGAEWAASKSDKELKYNDSGDTYSFRIDPDDGDATIWLPDDFDPGDLELYVGIDNDDGYDDGADVYWIISSTIYDLDIGGADGNKDITGLDGAGDVGDCSLIAGTYGRTYHSENSGDSWSKDKKQPVTGSSSTGAIYPVLADDYLDSGEAWASAGGSNGGVYHTTDGGVLWNGISLLDTDMDTLMDIEPTPDWGSGGALFVVADQDDGMSPPFWGSVGDHLWKYDGDNWEMIYHRYLMDDDDNPTYINDVEVSPDWASDETVLFADFGNNRSYRATDGGAASTGPSHSRLSQMAGAARH